MKFCYSGGVVECEVLHHCDFMLRFLECIILVCECFQYPEALRLAYPKLKERLDDSDPGES